MKTEPATPGAPPPNDFVGLDLAVVEVFERDAARVVGADRTTEGEAAVGFTRTGEDGAETAGEAEVVVFRRVCSHPSGRRRRAVMSAAATPAERTSAVEARRTFFISFPSCFKGAPQTNPA
jgi:2-methylcitrate dehydratase PrpD